MGSERAAGVARDPAPRRDVPPTLRRAASALRGPSGGGAENGLAAGTANDPQLRAADDFDAALQTAPTARVIEKRIRRVDAYQTFLGAAAKVAVFAAAAYALFAFVFGVARVQGDGMKPTAGDGDVALVYRLDSGLKVDDLVVYEVDGKKLVGRVVARPGDEVEVTSDGELKVNGTVQPSITGERTEPGSSGAAYPITLGEGEYFILGDGRTSATDSRDVGTVGVNEVTGKVIALLRLRDI